MLTPFGVIGETPLERCEELPGSDGFYTPATMPQASGFARKVKGIPSLNYSEFASPVAVGWA